MLADVNGAQMQAAPPQPGPKRRAQPRGQSRWLTNPADNEITRIDERSLQPQLIAVGTDPTALSVADGHAWVINDLSHSANEIDCGTTAVVKTLVFGTNAPRTAKLTPKGVSMASDGTAWIALQSF
jgi:DNA-binding beta-propeller fold protein YncE